MSGTVKAILMAGGILAALLLVAQIVMGQLILSGRADLIKAHQHAGYTTVVVGLLYVVGSLVAIAATPTKGRS